VWYPPLPNDQAKCQQLVLRTQRDAVTQSNRPEKLAIGEDDISFFGPYINLRTTSGKRETPESFIEKDILRETCLGADGRIRAQTNLCNPTSGSLEAHVDLEADHYVDANLICQGSLPDLRLFSFDI
jgi:hypothetical protein